MPRCGSGSHYFSLGRLAGAEVGVLHTLPGQDILIQHTDVGQRLARLSQPEAAHGAARTHHLMAHSPQPRGRRSAPRARRPVHLHPLRPPRLGPAWVSMRRHRSRGPPGCGAMADPAFPPDYTQLPTSTARADDDSPLITKVRTLRLCWNYWYRRSLPCTYDQLVDLIDQRHTASHQDLNRPERLRWRRGENTARRLVLRAQLCIAEAQLTALMAPQPMPLCPASPERRPSETLFCSIQWISLFCPYPPLLSH